jgi:ketosteroid isomerase-like protein
VARGHGAQVAPWGVLAALFIVSFAQGDAAQVTTDADMRALVDAERAFARMSVEKGMKEAFLANLAAESIVFRPGPVPAQAWFRDRPAASGTLSWEPDYAALSSAGDLGYTSGPWEYRDKGDKVYGHFVSVWRQQSDGRFKVVIDAGAAHPPPVGQSPLVLAPRPQAPPKQTPDARSALLEADRKLAHAIGSKPDWVEKFTARCADDVRLYRPGAFPVVGRTAMRTALAAQQGTWAWTPLGGGASRAGDLGYTYGTAEFHPADVRPDSVQATAYLRIWRRRADGGVEIVLDVANPMPSPRPARKAGNPKPGASP